MEKLDGALQARSTAKDISWKTPLETSVTPGDVFKALRFSNLSGVKESARYAIAMGTIAMLSGLTGVVVAIESVVFHSPEPLLLAGVAFGLAAFTFYTTLGNAHVTDQQYRIEKSRV